MSQISFTQSPNSSIPELLNGGSDDADSRNRSAEHWSAALASTTSVGDGFVLCEFSIANSPDEISEYKEFFSAEGTKAIYKRD